MKAAQITGRGRIELVDATDLHTPRKDEVIVTTETGCLCGSDIPFFSEPQAAYPLPPGLSLHEIVGRITASDSPSFRTGDRVLAMPLGLLGCAEQLRLASDRLVPIDEALSNEAAVLSQPMATVLSALSTVPNVVGRTVAVVGQGPIGLLFDTCLSQLGAARVIGIDVRESRVQRGCEFGATHVYVIRETAGRDAIAQVADITAGAMADLVVEAVGHEEQQFNLAAALARDKGRVLFFGIPPEKIDGIAFEAVVRKSLVVHTSVPDDLRPFVTIAQRVIKQGRLDPSRLITHRFPFTKIQDAFETYRDRRDGALKVVVDF
jgi:threonine dehydrogenase-like Zn-dependent dehydrogenase